MKRSALQLLLAMIAVLALTNCASVGPPLPPSLDLPKPPQDLRAARKGNRVTLTWTLPGMTTDRQTIRLLGPTRICRSTVELKDCATPVGEAPAATVSAPNKNARQKPTESFTDTLPAELENQTASGSVYYAVQVLNRAGRGAALSNQSRVLLAPTLPPPQDFQAQVTSLGVVLSWTKAPVPEQLPHTLHFVIRVYRRDQDAQQQTAVGQINIDSAPTLTDSEIEWEKTYDYHAETVTVVAEPNGSEAQVEGDDTPEVKVFAHDVFPPAVPSALQAVFSGPGQIPFIDLLWAPVTDSDLAGYNVYRHEEGTESMKINSEPLKTPAYRDEQVSAGKRYLYSVTSIDVRGNESAKSDEASEAVP